MKYLVICIGNDGLIAGRSIFDDRKKAEEYRNLQKNFYRVVKIYEVEGEIERTV